MKEPRKGMELVRYAVRLLDGCNETFNDSLTAEDAIKVADAMQRCAWDITPDRWEPKQVREALAGIVPEFREDKRRGVVAKYKRRPKPASPCPHCFRGVTLEADGCGGLVPCVVCRALDSDDAEGAAKIVNDALAKMKPAEPCPCGKAECHGFDVFDQEGEWLYIQRNDECGKYADDDAAIAAARKALGLKDS